MVSLVGYRVNNNPASAYASGTNPNYYQLERLGKTLSIDGEAYNSGTSGQYANNSKQPNIMVFLAYAPAGVDVLASGTYRDPTRRTYSNAYFLSTLAGAYSNNSSANWGFLPRRWGLIRAELPVATGAMASSTTARILLIVA